MKENDLNRDIKRLIKEHNKVPKWVTNVCFLIDSVAAIQEVCTNKKYRSMNIKYSCLIALDTILVNGGKISQRQLIEKMPVTKQAVTLALDNLEKLGLVTRESSLRDRRKRQILLTVKGTYLLNLIMLIRDEFFAKITTCISEDEANTLVNILSKIKNFYEEEIQIL